MRHNISANPTGCAATHDITEPTILCLIELPIASD
jgi:hypothetical protein